MKRIQALLAVTTVLAACGLQRYRQDVAPVRSCGAPGRPFPAARLASGTRVRIAACLNGEARTFVADVAQVTRDTLFLRRGGAVPWALVSGLEVGSDNRELSFVEGVAVGLAGGALNGESAAVTGAAALGTGVISLLFLPSWSWHPVVTMPVGP